MMYPRRCEKCGYNSSEKIDICPHCGKSKLHQEIKLKLQMLGQW